MYTIPPGYTFTRYKLHISLTEKDKQALLKHLIKFYSNKDRKYDNKFSSNYEEDELDITYHNSGETIYQFYLNVEEQINCINTTTDPLTNQTKNMIYKKVFHQNYPESEEKLYIENDTYINFIKLGKLFELNGKCMYIILEMANDYIPPDTRKRYCPSFLPHPSNKIFLRAHGSTIVEPFNIGTGTNVIKFTNVGDNVAASLKLEEEILLFYKHGYNLFKNDDNDIDKTFEGEMLEIQLKKKFPEINIHINIGKSDKSGKPIKLINNFNLEFNKKNDSRLRMEEAYAIDCMYNVSQQSQHFSTLGTTSASTDGTASHGAAAAVAVEGTGASAHLGALTGGPASHGAAAEGTSTGQNKRYKRILFNTNYVYDQFFNKVETLTLQELISINGSGTYIVIACRGFDADVPEAPRQMARQLSE